ncbi:glycosyl hydrolase [Mariannaea sp. PMI_226]|nr:glycosyl hydrolase [Mariannaea sp. PMI_226]
MKSAMPGGGHLLKAILSYAAFQNGVFGNVIPLTGNCHQNHYSGPENPSFETGSIKGWTVISGNAFGDASVSSETFYWGGPFNQVGKDFLWGLAQSGEAAVGQLHSSIFRASSVMSFLIGGGWDPINLYVGLVRDSDKKLLFSQTGTNDEALVRIIWDTSAYAGQNVYVVVYDNSTATSWGHINVDDIRTGCDALGDNGQSFTVLGQAHQPVRDQSILSVPQLYAADPIRPQYHYSPYQGWINDPAGLIEWNGRHQLFSQFNPDAPVWGPMHWSHADSADAVHWRELPVALYPPYPSNPLDTSGRFTGSAVRDNSTGGMHVIFTDARDTSWHPNLLPEVVSSAMSSNGIDFSLSSRNPIIAAPPPGSPSGFRDPKVFVDPADNRWKMVIGSGDAVSGKVHLYFASNLSLLSWEYVGVLHEGDGSTGTMWECPNFFPIGDKWVLIYGGDSLGYYEVGNFDGKKFTSQKVGLLDAGPDSYATQWYKDSAGRNLAITWMGNWPSPKWPSRVNGWAAAQSVTHGGLGSKPIKEIDRSTNTARLQMTVDLATTDAPGFTIMMYKSRAEQVTLYYAMASKVLTLNTTNAGYGQAGTWNATIASSQNNKLTLDILLDRSSVEIFAGDGTAMTATVYPRYQESTDIKIESS